MKTLILIFALLFSWYSPITKIESRVHKNCLYLDSSYGTYAYPSIYVVGIPADLEIVFMDGMTAYRFQGRNDTAIRAMLPSGTYQVAVYRGKERVSDLYAFIVKEEGTLMVSSHTNQECFPVPVPLSQYVF